MNWRTAVDLARSCGDVTYEEWCDLYYDVANPTHEQVQKASQAAHAILVRNKAIEPSVRFKIKIKSVFFRDSANRYGDKEAVAIMEDASSEVVFAWFRDELSFREDELIGKTIEEARDFRQARDIQYLQS